MKAFALFKVVWRQDNKIQNLNFLDDDDFSHANLNLGDRLYHLLNNKPIKRLV